MTETHEYYNKNTFTEADANKIKELQKAHTEKQRQGNPAFPVWALPQGKVQIGGYCAEKKSLNK